MTTTTKENLMNIPAKPASGTPIILMNVHGRRDSYLLLAKDGDHAVAHDGHGNYQGLRRSALALNGWKAVKVATADWDRAWVWARS